MRVHLDEQLVLVKAARWVRSSPSLAVWRTEVHRGALGALLRTRRPRWMSRMVRAVRESRLVGLAVLVPCIAEGRGRMVWPHPIAGALGAEEGAPP